jgi:threonine/homoserine/homoserine lactone efflux protein
MAAFGTRVEGNGTVPSSHLLWPFLLATLVFATIPGPGILYTAARTLAGGRRAGLMAALGVHIGGYGYVAATALGLSALLHYVPTLYVAVKLCGAAYLISLGVRMIGRRLEREALPDAGRRTAGRAFVESISVELLNPKTALFFVAFLPQFIDPSADLPVAVQFLILGTIVNLAFSAADVVTVMLASTVLHRLRRYGRSQRIARIAGGSILIGLGTRLALART